MHERLHSLTVLIITAPWKILVALSLGRSLQLRRRQCQRLMLMMIVMLLLMAVLRANIILLIDTGAQIGKSEQGHG